MNMPGTEACFFLWGGPGGLGDAGYLHQCDADIAAVFVPIFRRAFGGFAAVRERNFLDFFVWLCYGTNSCRCRVGELTPCTVRGKVLYGIAATGRRGPQLVR